jgi:hypothetical protein
MKREPRRKEKPRSAKSILRLPDLEAAKSAVLSSLSCPDAQRGYRHAIDEFMERYCSEPGCRSSRTWSYGTECIWSPAISLRAPSIFASERCAVLHMRRQTAGSSAPTWRRE